MLYSIFKPQNQSPLVNWCKCNFNQQAKQGLWPKCLFRNM